MAEFEKKVDKKLNNFTLVGLDGNAFNLMGRFKAEAKKQGWTPEEVKAVIEQSMEGDYNELVWTLNNYIDD